MKLTAKVKLLPTKAQVDSLKRTIETANQACNYISEAAWLAKSFRQFDVHKLVYHEVRASFRLVAQLVIRCIAKVADSYKIDKKTKREFRSTGSIPYDLRILSWKIADSYVSIWTVDGRQKIEFAVGDYQRKMLQSQRGETDLCLIDGEFYLYTTCDVAESELSFDGNVLGVDLGIANIATDSDGSQYSGKKVNNTRKRYAKLRSKLQAKQTKSAKRLLKKRSRKEKRFANDVNHVISKEIVSRAKDTGRAIALEDLTGINERVTVRKAQRRERHSWSFYDLRQKIEYKAKLYGVPVVLVDPRNTSRSCHSCGCIDKENRKSQSEFLCVTCGYSANADTNAAMNISVRGRAILSTSLTSRPRTIESGQGQADVI